MTPSVASTRRILTALALSLLVGAGACSSDPADGGSDNGTSGTPTLPLADNACRKLEPVHPIPNCDGCTRDVCCAAVLECDRATDCKPLRTCYQSCKQGDLACAEGCRSKHGLGQSTLDGLDRCAQFNCPIPCGTATVGGG